MPRRVPEPLYPSFALVVTQHESHYPLRLPAYRSAHVRRYHPYPRRAPPKYEDRLLTTVDQRHDELPDAQAAFDLQAVIRYKCMFYLGYAEDLRTKDAPPQWLASGEHHDQAVEGNNDTAVGDGGRANLIDLVAGVAQWIARRCKAMLSSKQPKNDLEVDLAE